MAREVQVGAAASLAHDRFLGCSVANKDMLLSQLKVSGYCPSFSGRMAISWSCRARVWVEIRILDSERSAGTR